MGDRWNDEQVDELLTGAPVKSGQFNYVEFTKQLKHGTEEAEEAPTMNVSVTLPAAPPRPSVPAAPPAAQQVRPSPVARSATRPTPR